MQFFFALLSNRSRTWWSRLELSYSNFSFCLPSIARWRARRGCPAGSARRATAASGSWPPPTRRWWPSWWGSRRRSGGPRRPPWPIRPRPRTRDRPPPAPRFPATGTPPRGSSPAGGPSATSSAASDPYSPVRSSPCLFAIHQRPNHNDNSYNRPHSQEEDEGSSKIHCATLFIYK